MKYFNWTEVTHNVNLILKIQTMRTTSHIKRRSQEPEMMGVRLEERSENNEITWFISFLSCDSICFTHNKLTMVRLRHSLHLSLKEWYEERTKEVKERTRAPLLFTSIRSSLHNMTLRLLSEEISIIKRYTFISKAYYSWITSFGHLPLHFGYFHILSGALLLLKVYLMHNIISFNYSCRL